MIIDRTPQYKKIAIVLAALVLLLAAALVVVSLNNSKRINELGAAVQTAGIMTNVSQNGKTPAGSAKQTGQTALADAINQFSGKATSVSAFQITIETQLTDFSKPKNPDKFKNANGPIKISSDDFESAAKTVKVNLNDSTQYEGGTLADIKAGSTVGVTSDKSPYGSDEVTAEKLIIIVKK
jgi:hypothetical protein